MLFDSGMDKSEKKEYKKVKTIASQYADEYDGTPKNNAVGHDIGICRDCGNLEYAETRWGKFFAKCSYLEIKLNTSDPIERCNKHVPSGKMDLSEMWSIYIPININEKKAGLL